MNGRDDEVWLDTLLQRSLSPGPSEDTFSERVLERLPPRPRPVRRALLLGVTGLAAAGALLLPELGGAGAVSVPDTQALLVPSILGTALLWYLADLFS